MGEGGWCVCVGGGGGGGGRYIYAAFKQATKIKGEISVCEQSLEKERAEFFLKEENNTTT